MDMYVRMHKTFLVEAIKMVDIVRFSPPFGFQFPFLFFLAFTFQVSGKEGEEAVAEFLTYANSLLKCEEYGVIRKTFFNHILLKKQLNHSTSYISCSCIDSV